MKFFRSLNQRTLLLWSILLSLSLILAQGLTIHIHNVDHAHYEHDNIFLDKHDNNHEHVSQAHFSHDASHDNHHEVVISEVDVSQNGLIKSSSTQILFFVIITCFFLLALPTLVSRVIRYHHDSDSIRNLCYFFNPPLRAPPF